MTVGAARLIRALLGTGEDIWCVSQTCRAVFRQNQIGQQEGMN